MNPVSPVIADEIQERLARRNVDADLHAVLNSEDFEELFAQVTIEQSKGSTVLPGRSDRFSYRGSFMRAKQ